jgi:hypothetical protein
LKGAVPVHGLGLVFFKWVQFVGVLGRIRFLLLLDLGERFKLFATVKHFT